VNMTKASSNSNPCSPSATRVPVDSIPPSPWIADASLIGVALIWGINIPIMKSGLEDINDWVFNSLRLTFSAGVLAVFAWLQYRRGNRPSPELRWRKVMAFGIMVSGIYQMLFLLGISRTTSGNTALIICTIPLWTALLARAFIGERLNLAAYIGLLIGLTGTVVVALQNDDVGGADTSLVGNLCVLASAITWSACTVYSRPMLTQISPMQLSACAAVTALPIHWLAAGPWYAESVEALRTPTVWAVMAYSGILSSGLALPMWNFGVRHAGAAHASAVQNLIPVIAIVAAWQWRNETPTGPQIAGGALILSGLLVMRATREKTANPPCAR